MKKRLMEKADAVRPQASASQHEGNTTPSQDTEDIKVKLIAFYKKHNPGNLKNLDLILVKYKGKEAELFQRLRRKYGDSDSSSSSAPSPKPVPSDRKHGGKSSARDTNRHQRAKDKSLDFRSPDFDPLKALLHEGIG